MRVPFPNLGAEEGALSGKSAAVVQELVRAWEALVARPPWPWLAAAEGVVAWLGTEDAAMWAAARELPLWGPPPSLVHVVHDKAFCLRAAQEAGLDPELAPLLVVLPPGCGPNDVEEAIARWPSWARRSFTVKPRLGTSGRGRVAGRDGRVERTFQMAHGAILEPWLARTLDLSSLWWVDPTGRPNLLGTTRARARTSGLYLGCDVQVSAAGMHAGTPWDQACIDAAHAIVSAAAARGFWGPCGVDAFVYAHPEHGQCLRGCVELNARFTAGHVALGLVAHESGGAPGRFSFRVQGEPLLVRSAVEG